MRREFARDRSDVPSTAIRGEQVRASSVKDMARANVRRLQAAREAAPGA